MDVLLTGATGYIGSAVLQRLLSSGHSVTALVRSDDAARTVAAAGATPVVADISDVGALTRILSEVDAAIHTASPGDATSAAVDSAVVAAVVSAFGGTTKPYIHTGGIWIWGSSAAITEDSPLQPPAITSWRIPIESSLFDADVVATVVAPAIVYGRGAGIAAILSSTPRAPGGGVVLVGSGEQHWATVDVDDLADLYVRVLETGTAHGYILGASGANPSVRQLGEAIAAASGAPGVLPESDDAARARLGGPFADALLLDQSADGAAARSLGWRPQAEPLVDVLRAGAYSVGG